MEKWGPEYAVRKSAQKAGELISVGEGGSRKGGPERGAESNSTNGGGPSGEVAEGFEKIKILSPARKDRSRSLAANQSKKRKGTALQKSSGCSDQ